MYTYTGGYYPHKKVKPLIIMSDRNSHELRESFEYKRAMALDCKIYSVFVFYLFWNAWCHLKSWYHAQAIVRAWYLVCENFFLFCLFAVSKRNLFFFSLLFKFLLMLFHAITVCAQKRKSLEAWRQHYFLSQNISAQFQFYIYDDPYIYVGNSNSSFHHSLILTHSLSLSFSLSLSLSRSLPIHHFLSD